MFYQRSNFESSLIFCVYCLFILLAPLKCYGKLIFYLKMMFDAVLVLTRSKHFYRRLKLDLVTCKHYNKQLLSLTLLFFFSIGHIRKTNLVCVRTDETVYVLSYIWFLYQGFAIRTGRRQMAYTQIFYFIYLLYRHTLDGDTNLNLRNRLVQDFQFGIYIFIYT